MNGFRACALVVVALSLAACGKRPAVVRSDAVIGGLDIDRATGQLMMVGFKGPTLTPAIQETLRELQPGGVCLYQQNITGPDQVARLNDELRVCLDQTLPPFLAIDHEGGVVVRIFEGATVFPSSMALGATHSAELAFETGRTVGKELRLMGFNMNLAPVLDTPQNPAIGSRAFSDNPRLIAKLGSAFIAGQQQAGVATVAKHFPGEGRSEGDSHYRLPVRWEAASAIRSELDPFCTAIEGGLDGIMTAHVAVPSLARNRLPATISTKLLTGVLRQELNFDGLILTDELEGMRAISAYGIDRAAIAAINAGADMVFVAFSSDVQRQVHRALIDAVRSGEISRARLEQALAHIVALKSKRQLFDGIQPRNERLETLYRRTGEQVARQIARKSITLIGSSVDCLPIKPNSRIALVTDSQNFADAIRTQAPQTKVLMVDRKSLQNLRSVEQSVQELATGSDAVIAAFIWQDRFKLVRNCSAPSRPLILVSMNVPGPNFLREIPKANAVLVNYSYQPVSAEATADVIFKNPLTPGTLPVQLEPNDSAVPRITVR